MLRPGTGLGRKKDFKKGVDAEDVRRKREDNIIELRKSKRDENLQKKRQVHAGPSYAIEESNRSQVPQLSHKVDRAVNGAISLFCPGTHLTRYRSLQLDELPVLVRQVYHGTPDEQFEATQKFRKLLSIGKLNFIECL